MPLDLVDPKTGIDYFTAVKGVGETLSRGDSFGGHYRRSGGSNSVLLAGLDGHNQLCARESGLPREPLRELAFPQQGSCVAAYDLFCGFGNNETTAIQGIDQGFGFRDFSLKDANGSRIPYYPTTGPYTFVDPQFASLTRGALCRLPLTMRSRLPCESAWPTACNST